MVVYYNVCQFQISYDKNKRIIEMELKGKKLALDLEELMA